MSLESLVRVWPRVTVATINEYARRLLGPDGAYLHDMGVRLQRENPVLYRFVAQSSSVSSDAYSLCMATMISTYCLSAIQQEFDAHESTKTAITGGEVHVPSSTHIPSVAEDAFPFALPRVTPEAIEEYTRRIEQESYQDALFDHLQTANPTLLSTADMMDAPSQSERAAYLAVLMQTYALLSIQYELDMKQPKN